jgi:sulfide:quinone oxidoreductase
MTSLDPHNFRVLIAGGGVAALEAALCLRELAGDRIDITMLCPQSEFVYRPMRVREPFAYAGARHYPLAEIARDLDIELRQDAFKWLDADQQLVHTLGVDRIEYDALLLAMGAKTWPAFSHAITLDDSRLDDQLHGLIQDLEGGYLHSLAFVAPSRMAWPLPIYELALMTAQRAYDMNVDVSITLVTPEDAPLAVFGGKVSEKLGQVLEENGILTLTSAHCETLADGKLIVHPGSRTLVVDRILALPNLYGPSTPGVPKGSPDGFIPVDAYCRVRGLERVFAAGDATDFAVKHGGIAAQQAVTAAHGIAALTGADVEVKPFEPVIHGVLLSLDKPLYVSAHITGGHGSSSEISEAPTWSTPPKIAAQHLTPYLKQLDQIAGITT